ncbi:MAG: hypothetical protein IPP34_20515 [Bacteroidetes bacterium]|nr:hypothetical protein [Bacteroidota bacterium]
MMPFALDKNFMSNDDSNEETEPVIEPASIPALHCYEAALLAADSLKTKQRSKNYCYGVA